MNWCIILETGPRDSESKLIRTLTPTPTKNVSVKAGSKKNQFSTSPQQSTDVVIARQF